MKVDIQDFNGAKEYFESEGKSAWKEMGLLLKGLPLFLHASDQRGIVGKAIFDPKGTNAYLTEKARALGWEKRSLPDDLRQFGVDVDAGKGSCIAEWQFSNYPFLWNNIIRAECIRRRKVQLASMGDIKCLSTNKWVEKIGHVWEDPSVVNPADGGLLWHAFTLGRCPMHCGT